MGGATSGQENPDIVVGVHPVLELLRAAPGRARTVYLAETRRDGGIAEIRRICRELSIPVERLPQQQFQKRFSQAVHQGVAARTVAVAPVALEKLVRIHHGETFPPCIVLLDGVEDPRNLGAILRSAEAMGISGVVLPSRRAAPLGATAAKTSAGAIHHLPYAIVPNIKNALEHLREMGFRIIGLEAGGESAPWEETLNVPLALVFGSEGRGIRPVIRKHCDRVVSIPLSGKVASLNVSVAAGVLFYEILRQRLKK